MSSSAEFLSNLKEAGQTVISTRRPWGQFLDLSALSLPSSLSEVSTRLSHNLTYFLFNYALLLLLLFLLSLLSHLLALLLFLILFAAWYFLYFSRDSDPLTLFNFVTLDDRILVLVLAVLSAVVLFTTGVWVNLFVSLAVGAVVVFLHGALRSTDDLVGDDQESPYGPMLTDPAGAYTRV
ncbi:PRA1 family protein D [Abrus precatorius]|uniref:PRA1 family protein n=1 Tax=Abrus precatorius TaxID=3816 RepID=A0A8B8MG52_ABRPR|nr:PRA1 family protein D [Abrus precatorius]